MQEQANWYIEAVRAVNRIAMYWEKDKNEEMKRKIEKQSKQPYRRRN